MNVSCPECRSIFRVDPSKVPAAGVRARCSVCGGIITVGAGESIDEEFGVEPSADTKAYERTIAEAEPWQPTPAVDRPVVEAASVEASPPA